MQAIEEDVESERTFTNQRFQMYMQRQELAAWVSSYCDQRLDPLEEGLEKKLKACAEKIQWIVDQNLTVPGLIGTPSEEGEEPKYADLASYLVSVGADLTAEITAAKTSLEESMNTLVDKMSATMEEQAQRLTDLEAALQAAKDDQAASTEKLDTDIGEIRTKMESKFHHVEHELEHLEEHLCEEKRENATSLLSKEGFERWRDAQAEETKIKAEESDKRMASLEQLLKDLEQKAEDLVLQCERRLKSDTKRQIELHMKGRAPGARGGRGPAALAKGGASSSSVSKTSALGVVAVTQKGKEASPVRLGSKDGSPLLKQGVPGVPLEPGLLGAQVRD